MPYRATRRALLSLLLPVLAVLPAADAAAAQERSGDPVATKPDSGGAKVMVLGTTHFFRRPELIMPPDRQAQLEAVLDGLERFRPTKILLEEEPRDSVRLDSLYRAYREGRHELTANERQQIGFRLADRMDLGRVWAVDYQHPWPMDKVTSFARRYDPDYMAYRERWSERTEELSEEAASGHLADLFRFYNGPEFLSHLQAIRMRTMEVDARGTWVGLEPNISIWKRNMRIFADIAAHAQAGERVVVVYGGGHAYFFRKWVMQHPRLELVEPTAYLPRPDSAGSGEPRRAGAAGAASEAPDASESAAAREGAGDPVATTPDSGGAKVLMLGSIHFYRRPELVEGPDRQEQLEAVLDALAEYRPTKVLVEEEPTDSTRMDSLYRAWRDGRWEMAPNERYQIGFRLADRMGLDRAWAVDYQHPWPMDKVTSFASRYDSAYMEYRKRWAARTAAMREAAEGGTLAEMYRYYNRSAFLAHIQAMRMRTMEVDARGTWVGLEPNVSYWTRNMRIFADIAAHAEPGERILVVYGMGHGYFFRKWARQHPRIEFVDPLDYLP
jgi:hypothetical protein